MKKQKMRFSELLGGEDYDLFPLAATHFFDLQRKVAEQVREHVGERENVVMFEAGTGTGDTIREVMELCPNCMVVCLDNEPEMLKVAERRLQDHKENLEFVCADVYEYLTKCEDGKFDVFFSGFTLHNIRPEQREKIMREAGRVLKPGGLYVNGDKIAVSDKEKHQKDFETYIKLFDVFEDPEINRPELKKEWTDHYCEDEEISFTETEQKGLLEKNGFGKTREVYRELIDSVVVAIKK